MRDKIAEIIGEWIHENRNEQSKQDGRAIRVGVLTDKILSLIHSEMVGLVQMESIHENASERRGWNRCRSDLLSAIEKKFGEAL